MVIPSELILKIERMAHAMQFEDQREWWIENRLINPPPIRESTGHNVFCYHKPPPTAVLLSLCAVCREPISLRLRHTTIQINSSCCAYNFAIMLGAFNDINDLVHSDNERHRYLERQTTS